MGDSSLENAAADSLAPHSCTIAYSEPLRRLLRQVVDLAAPLRVALVGGTVRDLLLHRPHNDPRLGLPDLDLIVEESTPGVRAPAAHRVAITLRQQLGKAVSLFHLHDAFGTAELEVNGILLDIATARQEHYPEPGSHPVVQFGSLEDDLSRRDLSINAMAMVLDPRENNTAHLLDPFDGRSDLARHQLRFLHADSLRDDPTRIVRAARYGARLGMDLSKASLIQVHTTLADWPWQIKSRGSLPGLGTRLRSELELLLGREPWEKALMLLQQWGSLVLLDPGLQHDRHWLRRLRRAQRLAARLERPPWPQEEWLLLALLARLDDPLTLAKRLQLAGRCHRLLTELLRLRGWVCQTATEPEWSPSRLSQALERQGFSPEGVTLLLAAYSGLEFPPRLRRGLLRWLLHWRTLRAEPTADDLIAAGERPGPGLGMRLRQLRAERLDRQRW
jgi:poly(A) polymerase